jgi:hypothetical protein
VKVEEDQAPEWRASLSGEAHQASAELRARLGRVVTNKELSAFGVPGAIFGVI